MTLGNSITQGNTEHPSYRYPLWKKLIDAEIDFEYVGSHNVNSGGIPNLPDYKGKKYTNLNEGHWGWRADQLLRGHNTERNKGKLSDWLEGYTPDMVLLHAGSNDVMQEQPVDQTIKELEDIVREIRKKNPGVTILLAKLIPVWREKVGQPTVDRLYAFNAQIPALANKLNTAQSPVLVVEQPANFDPTPGADTWDGIHPNASGEEKMAQNWFEAIASEIIVPLPVELHSFQGIATESGIQLSWTTASEEDNHYFEVQRSQDGANFNAIGQVKGAGTTSLKQTYTFEDTAALAGTSYYRLRQVDFSDEQSYSAVVAVTYTQDETVSMQLYPTQTQGDPVTLKMSALQPQEKFTIGIYTLEGKLVKAFEAEADGQGNYSELLHPGDLQNARLYMVRAATGDRVYLRHLMVDL
ncbi:cellulose-binding protein [Pontibacter sp. HJ8]